MRGAKVCPDPDPELNDQNSSGVAKAKRGSSRPYYCLAQLFKCSFVGGRCNSSRRKRKEFFAEAWQELTYPGAGG